MNPASLRAAAEGEDERWTEAWRLTQAAAALLNRESQAARLDRAAAKVAQRLDRAKETERKRAVGGLYAGQHRSPNRPVHAEVDDEAWFFVKADALRRRKYVGEVVGQLVVRASRGLSIGLYTDGLAGEHAGGRRATRFVRLVGVDDERWATFRARGVDTDVTAARLVGLVVEAEARRLGWTGQAER